MEKEVAEITERALRGELDWEQGFWQRIELVKGATFDEVMRAVERLKPEKRAFELLEELEKCAEVTILSQGFRIVVERYFPGFTAYLNELIFRDNLLEGARLLVKDKGDFLRKLGGAFLAVGDGANDLAMFKHAKIGIAYRAREILVKKADFSVKNMKELRKVLEEIGVL